MTDLLEVDDESASPRGRRRRRRGPARVLAVLVVLLLIGVMVAGALYLVRSFAGDGGAPDYSGAGTGEVTVEIQPGDTAGAVGETLVSNDVVKSRQAFFEVTRDDPRTTSLQPGFYGLRRQMSASAAFELLLDPAARLVGRVTVPEGLTVEQTLERLAEQSEIPLADFQEAAKNTSALGLPDFAEGRLEGFLFPATYEIDPGASAVDVLTQLVTRFNQAADKVGLVERAGEVDRTPYEIVVVASLIEREVKRDDEYPKVAQVVYNRLEQGIPLGIDASTLFGVGKTAGGELTRSDLAKDTPYENRRRKGLPPTPIASPGEATLEGALSPSTGDLLYYVLASKDGETFFTSDYQAFLRQKQKSLDEGVF